MVVQRARNWCFTLHDYTESQCTMLLNLASQEEDTTSSGVTYICFGKEVCTSTQRPHLQGYIELSKPITMAGLKTLLNSKTVHLETRKDTAKDAIVYCQKEGSFYEAGSKKSQGKRKDIEVARDIVNQGGGMSHVLDEVTSYQAVRMAEVLLTYKESARNWKPTVYWYHGATGTGKSRKARWLASIMDGSSLYVKSDPTRWYPGYDRHNFVIFDDFRPSWMPLTDMLRLLDRYEARVEFKGGYRQFVPNTIVVTSALHPKDCYTNSGEAIEQLLRRIDHIEHFNTAFPWTEPTVPERSKATTELPEINDIINN